MQKYAAAWKRFRAKQQTVLDGYDPLKPEAAARIGKSLLSSGIPGDPLINWVWGQHYE